MAAIAAVLPDRGQHDVSGQNIARLHRCARFLIRPAIKEVAFLLWRQHGQFRDLVAGSDAQHIANISAFKRDDKMARMSDHRDLCLVRIPAGQAGALLRSGLCIGCILCHGPRTELVCGGRFFIGAEAALQPVTAGVLLVLIGMTQSGRFVGTVAVAAFAGVNGIAAAGAGSRNHGRHTVMGMAFLGDDGDRFCFGVAAITVVGQNAFVRFCGLRCDLCTAEHMGFHIDFGCAAISAPVPMLVIIIVLFSQCGGAVSAHRAVMRLPLVAFHADAVAAAIAAAHVRTADHAQLAAVAERLALLADAAGRTGLGAVPAEGSTVRAQRCTVAAVMAVVTHSIVVPGTLRTGPTVGAEVLHAVLAPGAVRAHDRAVCTVLLAVRANVLAVFAGAAALTVLAAVLAFPALGAELAAYAVPADIAVGAHVCAVPADLSAFLADHRAVTARSAVMAELIHALVTAAAVRAEILRAIRTGQTLRAEVDALIADRHALGAKGDAVLARAARFAVSAIAAEAVGAVVDVGADPIHAVAAQLTVAAPFACTVQTRIAALLADQGALGAHAAVAAVVFDTIIAKVAVRAGALRAAFAGQAPRAEISAIIADRHALGAKGDAVLARAARFAVSAIAAEAVGAVVDVGADPIHAVAAQLTVAAPFACTVQTRIAALLADQGALGAHAAVAAVVFGTIIAKVAVRAGALRAVFAGQAPRAEISAIIADRHALGAKGNTVLARAARFAVSAIAAEAVGAVVDVGADPIHAVAAQLTVAAPFACTVQTRIAALLADQGALGAHAAAGTVSVGAVGADPTVRADIIPAFSAMFTAFRADLRTIRAAFVADADGHAVAAVVAVAAPAIASRAVLAAVTITAHFLAAFLTLLAAGQTDIAAAGAGLSAVADELRAVFAHAAALTGRACAGGAHTALRAELVPAVAAVLGAVRTDIRALGAAIAFEAGDLTVTADVAVAAPAVAVRAVLAASAFFAERIPADATALGT